MCLGVRKMLWKTNVAQHAAVENSSFMWMSNPNYNTSHCYKLPVNFLCAKQMIFQGCKFADSLLLFPYEELKDIGFKRLPYNPGIMFMSSQMFQKKNGAEKESGSDCRAAGEECVSDWSVPS